MFICENEHQSFVEEARALGQVELARELLEWQPDELRKE
jgi:hypothetical protein